MQKRRPAVGILKEIGLPAVPPLLEVLKKNNLDDHDAGFPLRHILAIFCLRDIYDQGGFGVQLARQRIELEMKKANPKEKKYLERALKHYCLEVKE